ncbi:MAG: hypothetical protein A3K06_03200 [Candidatus Doudnabacteria bacterium RIFCSPHIGHO2_01_52_17]|uniref:Pilus assembly protein PilO n=1 Tax=Candidatus Doudnabacteria bacterium RIFCSPHIGHO2_01_52_17 TaxID=1817820 RepID=A0A1F5NCF4_9BACT|nr:MAG: hypothetical protein UY65_C0009G0013 [Parcubacteria group bacterium GW2011_GWA2_51_12]OGE75268.1 MAG: hypothetical protein A3K06_03200 [Candidatus Doudnabacteria bacterium RIFCSPHIGHO2_01_52_17]
MKGSVFNSSQFSSGIVVPLLVVAMIGIGYFVVWPKYQVLQETKQVLDTKVLDVTLREGQLQSIQSLVNEFDKKRDTLSALDLALPTAAKIPELLANFDVLAAQSGLELNSVNFSLLPDLDTPVEGLPESEFLYAEAFREQAKNLRILQAAVLVKGLYPGFKTFLAVLEQNLRLMDVEGISITSPGSAEGELQQMNVTINIYYHRNAVPAGE